jgi:hypothetical protein
MARTEQSADRRGPWNARSDTQIARFGTSSGGHLGDQFADHIGRDDVRHASHTATTQRDVRAASLRCTGRRRASAGEAAR